MSRWLVTGQGADGYGRFSTLRREVGQGVVVELSRD